ncbi:hypothetical protein BHE74_00017248 [Ensete ventricosum]|nr:hypothetical protein GW17_00021688 [Ensete ventricosum]RWW74790.1 hypothetical protein BHE74_00017248 [Ensete ventricosum]RZR96188.1 hypothetical protein BHM03_00025153 [Ensete ventricosum]
MGTAPPPSCPHPARRALLNPQLSPSEMGPLSWPAIMGEEGHVNASRGPGERVVILIWSNLTVLVVSQAGTCNGSPPAAAAAVEGTQSHPQWA